MLQLILFRHYATTNTLPSFWRRPESMSAWYNEMLMHAFATMDTGLRRYDEYAHLCLHGYRPPPARRACTPLLVWLPASAGMTSMHTFTCMDITNRRYNEP
jgi:hypothetical protein